MEISAPGAPNKPYVKSVTVNGKAAQLPFIDHVDIAKGGTIAFEMSETPEEWTSGTMVGYSNQKAVKYSFTTMPS